MFFYRDHLERNVSHPCMDSFRHCLGQKNDIASIFRRCFNMIKYFDLFTSSGGVVALVDIILGF